MNKELPENLSSFTEDPEEIDERDKSSLWKLKGIASQMTYRIFSKYGNPKFVDDELKEFSQYF